MANASTKNNGKKRGRLLPSGKGLTLLLILMTLVAIGFLVMIAVVDAFPKNMTLGFIVVLLVALALANFLFHREKKGWRILGIVLAVVFMAVYGMGIYYLSTTYAMFSRITVDDTKSEALAKGVDVTEDAFNIYLTGIDQWESEKGYDLERSDVNMIVTVNPKTRKILMTSIPRDTYVPLHRNGQMDKLTHTGVYGVDETINTVEDWTGLDLNYYVKINFSAVRAVIDAMGGIDVESPKAFKSAISPYSYKKGMNHMNGKKALYFARERKAFDSEDSQRVELQQRVMKAALDKLLSSSTLLTKYGDILKACRTNMTTNLSNEDMQNLVKMQLGDLGAWNIEMQKVTGEYDMDYVASLTQESTFLVYKVDKDSLKGCLANIEKAQNPTAAELAEATAQRQKNSFFAFFKGLFGKDEGDKIIE